jgi:hypothetical protein
VRWEAHDGQLFVAVPARRTEHTSEWWKQGDRGTALELNKNSVGRKKSDTEVSFSSRSGQTKIVASWEIKASNDENQGPSYRDKPRILCI